MVTEPSPRERPVALEEDDALVARLLQRDEGALRVLHKRYAPLVFTVAARIVDASAAEEVTQDVFLTVWRQAGDFRRERGSFKGWILRITRNRALNELRKRRSRPGGGDEALGEVADDKETPDEAQWAAHRRAALQKAIDALPAPEKQALSLAFFEELTHEQVAAALRMPLGTAKTRIRLAVKRLAPALLALLVAAAIAIVWRREEGQQAIEQRALRLVTASDVTPVRLAPSQAVPPEAHGTYRAKAGTDVAVLTASRLPAPGADEHYAAWARHGQQWSLLGVLEQADESGRSLLVIHGPAVAAPVDEVRVTRERTTGAAPGGVPVLLWEGTTR